MSRLAGGPTSRAPPRPATNTRCFAARRSIGLSRDRDREPRWQRPQLALYTATAHAAVSSDNGLSWLALHPRQDLLPQYDKASAATRSPTRSIAADSLVFWLRQFRYDGTAGDLSLIIFQAARS